MSLFFTNYTKFFDPAKCKRRTLMTLATQTTLKTDDWRLWWLVALSALETLTAQTNLMNLTNMMSFTTLATHTVLWEYLAFSLFCHRLFNCSEWRSHFSFLIQKEPLSNSLLRAIKAEITNTHSIENFYPINQCRIPWRFGIWLRF